MDEKLLGQFRTAKTATFIIFETPEEGIGFPLSWMASARGIRARLGAGLTSKPGSP